MCRKKQAFGKLPSTSHVSRAVQEAAGAARGPSLPPAALPGAKLLKKFDQNFCLAAARQVFYKPSSYFGTGRGNNSLISAIIPPGTL